MGAPGVMAGVGIAGQVAQGYLGYKAAKAEGQAGYNQAMYQAGVAQMNAQIAKQNADYARGVGEVEAQQRGFKTRAQIGSTRAIQGASGLDVNRGSAVRVRESIADVGAHDVEIVRNNAARKAYGHEVEAANATAQGRLYEASAINAKTSAKYKAYSSLISGATGAAGKFSSASQSGMFGGPGGGGSESHHAIPMSWG